MNAANEVAVAAFLEDRIGFLEIPDVVEGVMSRWNNIEDPTVEDLLAADAAVRREGALV